MSHIVGGAPSSGSGLVGKASTDSIVAVYYAQPTDKGSVINESWNFAFVSGNRKSGTSKFLCQVNIVHGQYSNNDNTDTSNPGFRWRHVFNNSSGTATTTDIVGGFSMSGWYYSDVPFLGRTGRIYNGGYDSTEKTSLAQIIEPPKGNVGDPFSISQLVRAGTGGIWLSRTRNQADMGHYSTMVCYEIETNSTI